MKPLLPVALLAALLAAPAYAATPDENMTKAGCMACHAKDKKQVGPSFKDIAARYKGQANAVDALVAKVRAGGKGVYGPIPMPPHPPEKIGDADLKAVVAWMLQG